MSVRFVGNPMADIVKAFRKLHPKKSANISFQPTGARRKGQTAWGRGHTPLITVDPGLPYVGCMDILAHELAHVAAGPKAKHGPKWKAIYDAIHEEYRGIIARSAKRQKTEAVGVEIL